MTQKIFIKPAKPAIKVRKLSGGHLSESGEYVPREIYYLKRIKDGDAVQVTDEAEIKKILAKAKADAKKSVAAKAKNSTDEEA